jgi:hypothetical protein
MRRPAGALKTEADRAATPKRTLAGPKAGAVHFAYGSGHPRGRTTTHTHGTGEWQDVRVRALLASPVYTASGVV